MSAHGPSTVLVDQCHVSAGVDAGSCPDIQRQSRRRGVSDILLGGCKAKYAAQRLGFLLIFNQGISCGGSSMGYSVTKAAGLHLMKCLASTQGPKIRVNAVLPGLLLTEWVSLASFTRPLASKHLLTNL